MAVQLICELELQQTCYKSEKNGTEIVISEIIKSIKTNPLTHELLKIYKVQSECEWIFVFL